LKRESIREPPIRQAERGPGKRCQQPNCDTVQLFSGQKTPYLALPGDTMTRLLLLFALTLGLAVPAYADIWKWVDANGKTHFVDTKTAIYTWIGEDGRVHYADTPDHEDAVSVELVWHSPGTLADLAEDGEEDGASDGYAYPGETAEERAEREKAEAYYCKRATEIFESYLNAPRLFRTSESGEREYLSEEDAAATIAETKAKMNELCR
jgi:hypothetical protein